jgi:hypothetical protein
MVVTQSLAQLLQLAVAVAVQKTDNLQPLVPLREKQVALAAVVMQLATTAQELTRGWGLQIKALTAEMVFRALLLAMTKVRVAVAERVKLEEMEVRLLLELVALVFHLQ